MAEAKSWSSLLRYRCSKPRGKHETSMQLVTKPMNNTSLVAGENFYQQLNGLLNTIISLQYSNDEFLSFYANHAQQGTFIKSGTEVIGLRCNIKNTTYIFNREHFYQLSNREIQALFDQLGLDSREFFKV